ncbi:MAG: amino acid ABC transporter permease [Coriobacteriia bacterium]|nr:amino acid ABC transporter permease [Coriobacteriia bacterium]
MSPKLRRVLWYVGYAAVGAVLVALLLNVTGPVRLLYERPAERGSTGMVDSVYLISTAKDSVTIGKRGNVTLAKAVMDVELGATLNRVPPGADSADSKWVLTAQETSPTPVLVNGKAVREATLVPGDVIEVGGIEVTYDGSREGIAGAIDWWESGKITHLFASPDIISRAFPILLAAFPVSLFSVLVAFALAIPGGLALAFMKMAKTRWLRWPATIYVDIVRGTPIFLQILLVFFGLPLLPPWQALVKAIPQLNDAGLFGVANTMYLRAFVVLSFNSAAYMAEIFRAGIQSISKGQMEAARSLGMTTTKAMTYVIIPQTVRRILPTMMSEFILLFKDTSLFAAVGMPEIIMRSREVASTTLNVSPYVLAAGFYLVITVPLGRFVASLEERLARSEGGGMATFDKSTEENLAVAAQIKNGEHTRNAGRA